MMENKLFGHLGIARRAGMLVFGYDSVVSEAASRKASIVVLSSDASPRTVRNVLFECEKSRTKVVIVPVTKLDMGHAIGRGETGVVAITNKAFAAKVEEICRKFITEDEKTKTEEITD
jgi:ribosomal protein L7Ae-like RNA K-turn-binding protein